jgi:hypothetical protein
MGANRRMFKQGPDHPSLRMLNWNLSEDVNSGRYFSGKDA